MNPAALDCDILVVGGGVAGVCAAVSAARLGASTVLVESNPFPGGIPIVCLHRYICGLFLNGADLPEETINGGITSEIRHGLKRLAPGATAVKMGKVYVLPFSTNDLLTVLAKMSGQEKNLRSCFKTRAFEVQKEQNTITSIKARAPDADIAIFPRSVIDCTGTAVIAGLSGLPTRSPSAGARQLSGFSFRVSGLSDNGELLALKVPYYLAKAAANRELPEHLKFTVFTGTDIPGEAICKMSIPPSTGPGRNDGAGRDALLAHDYLSKNLPEFRNSSISEMSAEVVDRDGLRISGEYTLSRGDVLSGRKFPDGVVKNAWPIELWVPGEGPRYEYLPPGDYYEIPERCMRVGEISNYFCAGRCISASSEAMGSARVMGACMSMGEQAARMAVNTAS